MTGVPMTVKRVGIIGAGQMGEGIAQVSAAAGMAVTVYDVSENQAAACKHRITERLEKRVANGSTTAEEKQSLVDRISATVNIRSLENADLVIEAATENESVKQKIFAGLQGILKPEAVLATNTSSLSITRLAASTDRPAQFMGIHFMNPVPVMKLVELVRGIATAPETFGLATRYVAAIGKMTTISEDFPAFIVNRILIPMINEAIYTLHEGVGTIADIDRGMMLGANHPMGPLELADFIGLDTCLAIMQTLHEGLADSKYRPCPLLVKYVEAGWLGRKAGRGFYAYEGSSKVPTR